MLGDKRFEVEYLSSVVKEDIPSLGRTKALLKQAIEERLMIDPIAFGKPLQYSLKGDRSLRVDNYRIVYSIDIKTYTVLIVAIKHRKDVYKRV